MTWSEFTYDEIMSMHGLEKEDLEDEKEDDPWIDEPEISKECPRCMGSGCNYCLMTEY